MDEVAAFVVGLLLGSFLNATALRVQSRRTASTAATARRPGGAGRAPEAAFGGSVWFSRSACPCCGHTLAARDLVPVLSWVLLWGRCRYCSARISSRYPVSELLTGVLCSLAYAAL